MRARAVSATVHRWFCPRGYPGTTHDRARRRWLDLAGTAWRTGVQLQRGSLFDAWVDHPCGRPVVVTIVSDLVARRRVAASTEVLGTGAGDDEGGSARRLAGIGRGGRVDP